MLCRRLWLLIVAARILSASEPFQLRLSDLSETWFVSGAIVRVPMDKCAQLEVMLRKPWSQEIGVDLLELTMDGAYPRFTRSTSTAGHFLTIRTREPLGLLVKPEHHVEVSGGGPRPLHGEWTILRWDKAYIQATAVGKQGIPIGIRVDQPPGGVVLAGPNSGNVRFRGEVMGSGSSRMAIQNREVKRLADKPGFQFDEQIPMAVDAKEIVVVATDDGDSNSTTTLILPVTRP
jgi:hypothetical protein